MADIEFLHEYVTDLDDNQGYRIETDFSADGHHILVEVYRHNDDAQSYLHANIKLDDTEQTVLTIGTGVWWNEAYQTDGARKAAHAAASLTADLLTAWNA